MDIMAVVWQFTNFWISYIYLCNLQCLKQCLHSGFVQTAAWGWTITYDFNPPVKCASNAKAVWYLNFSADRIFEEYLSRMWHLCVFHFIFFNMLIFPHSCPTTIHPGWLFILWTDSYKEHYFFIASTWRRCFKGFKSQEVKSREIRKDRWCSWTLVIPVLFLSRDFLSEKDVNARE